MTTAQTRKKPRGWLPPRAGGYVPGERVIVKPARTPVEPPRGGGGVGNLRAHRTEGDDE